MPIPVYEEKGAYVVIRHVRAKELRIKIATRGLVLGCSRGGRKVVHEECLAVPYRCRPVGIVSDLSFVRGTQDGSCMRRIRKGDDCRRSSKAECLRPRLADRMVRFSGIGGGWS